MRVISLSTLMGRTILDVIVDFRCEEPGRNCEKEFLRYWVQRGSLTVENEVIPPQPNKLVQAAAA